MTKAELIKALADIPDDAEVCIAYINDADIHPINNVKKLYSNGVYLETEEVPNIENLQNMAEALLEQGILSRDDIDLLEDFIC